MAVAVKQPKKKDKERAERPLGLPPEAPTEAEILELLRPPEPEVPVVNDQPAAPAAPAAAASEESRPVDALQASQPAGDEGVVEEREEPAAGVEEAVIGRPAAESLPRLTELAQQEREQPATEARAVSATREDESAKEQSLVYPLVQPPESPEVIKAEQTMSSKSSFPSAAVIDTSDKTASAPPMATVVESSEFLPIHQVPQTQDAVTSAAAEEEESLGVVSSSLEAYEVMLQREVVDTATVATYRNEVIAVFEMSESEFVNRHMDPAEGSNPFFLLLQRCWKTCDALHRFNLEVLSRRIELLKEVEGQLWSKRTATITDSTYCIHCGHHHTATHSFERFDYQPSRQDTLSKSLRGARCTLPVQSADAVFAFREAKRDCDRYVKQTLQRLLLAACGYAAERGEPGVGERDHDALRQVDDVCEDPTRGDYSGLPVVHWIHYGALQGGLHQDRYNLRDALARARMVLDAVFWFLRGPCRLVSTPKAVEEAMMTHLQGWSSPIVGAMLRVAPLSDHYFLAQHLLRCGQGVCEWAAPFLQLPTSVAADAGGDGGDADSGVGVCVGFPHVSDGVVTHWTTQSRDYFLTLLSAVVRPLPEKPPEKAEDDDWCVVPDQGALLLTESDFISLFEQLPFHSFLDFLFYTPQRSVSPYVEWLNALACVRHLCDTIQQGTLRVSCDSPALVTRLSHALVYTLSRVAAQVMTTCTLLDVDQAKRGRLEKELNLLVLRAIPTLMASKTSQKFLVDLPVQLMRFETVWGILWAVLNAPSPPTVSVVSPTAAPPPTRGTYEDFINSSLRPVAPVFTLQKWLLRSATYRPSALAERCGFSVVLSERLDRGEIALEVVLAFLTRLGVTKGDPMCLVVCHEVIQVCLLGPSSDSGAPASLEARLKTCANQLATLADLYPFTLSFILWTLSRHRHRLAPLLPYLVHELPFAKSLASPSGWAPTVEDLSVVACWLENNDHPDGVIKAGMYVMKEVCEAAGRDPMFRDGEDRRGAASRRRHLLLMSCLARIPGRYMNRMDAKSKKTRLEIDRWAMECMALLNPSTTDEGTDHDDRKGYSHPSLPLLQYRLDPPDKPPVFLDPSSDRNHDTPGFAKDYYGILSSPKHLGEWIRGLCDGTVEGCNSSLLHMAAWLGWSCHFWGAMEWRMEAGRDSGLREEEGGLPWGGDAKKTPLLMLKRSLELVLLDRYTDAALMMVHFVVPCAFVATPATWRAEGLRGVVDGLTTSVKYSSPKLDQKVIFKAKAVVAAVTGGYAIEDPQKVCGMEYGARLSWAVGLSIVRMQRLFVTDRSHRPSQHDLVYSYLSQWLRVMPVIELHTPFIAMFGNATASASPIHAGFGQGLLTLLDRDPLSPPSNTFDAPPSSSPCCVALRGPLARGLEEGRGSGWMDTWGDVASGDVMQPPPHFSEELMVQAPRLAVAWMQILIVKQLPALHSLRSVMTSSPRSDLRAGVLHTVAGRPDRFFAFYHIQRCLEVAPLDSPLIPIILQLLLRLFLAHEFPPANTHVGDHLPYRSREGATHDRLLVGSKFLSGKWYGRQRDAMRKKLEQLSHHYRSHPPAGGGRRPSFSAQATEILLSLMKFMVECLDKVKQKPTPLSLLDLQPIIEGAGADRIFTLISDQNRQGDPLVDLSGWWWDLLPPSYHLWPRSWRLPVNEQRESTTASSSSGGGGASMHIFQARSPQRNPTEPVAPPAPQLPAGCYTPLLDRQLKELGTDERRVQHLISRLKEASLTFVEKVNLLCDIDSEYMAMLPRLYKSQVRRIRQRVQRHDRLPDGRACTHWVDVDMDVPTYTRDPSVQSALDECAGQRRELIDAEHTIDTEFVEMAYRVVLLCQRLVRLHATSPLTHSLLDPLLSLASKRAAVHSHPVYRLIHTILDAQTASTAPLSDFANRSIAPYEVTLASTNRTVTVGPSPSLMCSTDVMSRALEAITEALSAEEGGGEILLSGLGAKGSWWRLFRPHLCPARFVALYWEACRCLDGEDNAARLLRQFDVTEWLRSPNIGDVANRGEVESEFAVLLLGELSMHNPSAAQLPFREHLCNLIEARPHVVHALLPYMIAPSSLRWRPICITHTGPPASRDTDGRQAASVISFTSDAFPASVSAAVERVVGGCDGGLFDREGRPYAYSEVNQLANALVPFIEQECSVDVLVRSEATRLLTAVTAQIAERMCRGLAGGTSIDPSAQIIDQTFLSLIQRTQWHQTAANAPAVLPGVTLLLDTFAKTVTAIYPDSHTRLLYCWHAIQRVLSSHSPQLDGDPPWIGMHKAEMITRAFGPRLKEAGGLRRLGASWPLLREIQGVLSHLSIGCYRRHRRWHASRVDEGTAIDEGYLLEGSPTHLLGLIEAWLTDIDGAKRGMWVSFLEGEPAAAGGERTVWDPYIETLLMVLLVDPWRPVGPSTLAFVHDCLGLATGTIQTPPGSPLLPAKEPSQDHEESGSAYAHLDRPALPAIYVSTSAYRHSLSVLGGLLFPSAHVEHHPAAPSSETRPSDEPFPPVSVRRKWREDGDVSFLGGYCHPERLQLLDTILYAGATQWIPASEAHQRVERGLTGPGPHEWQAQLPRLAPLVQFWMAPVADSAAMRQQEGAATTAPQTTTDGGSSTTNASLSAAAMQTLSSLAATVTDPAASAVGSVIKSTYEYTSSLASYLPVSLWPLVQTEDGETPRAGDGLGFPPSLGIVCLFSICWRLFEAIEEFVNGLDPSDLMETLRKTRRRGERVLLCLTHECDGPDSHPSSRRSSWTSEEALIDLEKLYKPFAQLLNYYGDRKDEGPAVGQVKCGSGQVVALLQAVASLVEPQVAKWIGSPAATSCPPKTSSYMKLLVLMKWILDEDIIAPFCYSLCTETLLPLTAPTSCLDWAALCFSPPFDAAKFETFCASKGLTVCFAVAWERSRAVAALRSRLQLSETAPSTYPGAFPAVPRPSPDLVDASRVIGWIKSVSEERETALTATLDRLLSHPSMGEKSSSPHMAARTVAPVRQGLDRLLREGQANDAALAVLLYAVLSDFSKEPGQYATDGRAERLVEGLVRLAGYDPAPILASKAHRDGFLGRFFQRGGGRRAGGSASIQKLVEAAASDPSLLPPLAQLLGAVRMQTLAAALALCLSATAERASPAGQAAGPFHAVSQHMSSVFAKETMPPGLASIGQQPGGRSSSGSLGSEPFEPSAPGESEHQPWVCWERTVGGTIECWKQVGVKCLLHQEMVVKGGKDRETSKRGRRGSSSSVSEDERATAAAADSPGVLMGMVREVVQMCGYHKAVFVRRAMDELDGPDALGQS
ncbi:unnamed protein product [Vitrella brassicaformis CCMP3155]|uniref:Uncharacterized protein n=1 Tax=Vitrella brassicaformis (strain CCMP3155) TaxID=1169540 RepID=A0A0G4G3G5_VITBC|nr:unnamed protein product [Vitrella brassicaformis CCMP3155]|eukprot:CEM22496.1 unnamed protein product [Vitrella brassicaformis CCMP3155]